MGGMKDEAKRITIPPLFPRVHVNDTEREVLSLYKHSTLPSPTNKISDSPSTLSLSLPPPANNTHLTERSEKNEFSPTYNTSAASKLEGINVNKKGMNYPNPRGSSVTNTKPSSIKQNEYHFKNLTNLDSLKVPVFRFPETDPKANTDLSLQFHNSSTSKSRGEAAGSKPLLNNLHIQELLLPQCLEDESKKGSLSVMETQLYRRRALDTRKKPPREQDASDCSAVDFLSGMSAASNDVARVIGEKRFWKMRTYIISQQKIFATQVFELHRLIMVQKMVSKSPNLVFKNKINGGKRSTMSSSQSHLLEMAGSKVKRPNTENQKRVTEDYPEHMKPNLPLPFISKELMTPIWQQQLLPPPGNQWLVPVMSPSEGLVYKPYAGPCPPPPSAFMLPIYGQDSLATASRFPASTQFSHNHFPPRTKVFDHTNPFGQLQRWSSTSSHMTQAIPFSLKKSDQESNDSEVHGSTASSPPEKYKYDVLPLFPTEPTHHTDEYEHKQQPLARAIKAIPHNSTSASESAARIFRSIQEERRDSDHMIS
ncbi:hydroxyproline-rich glycoprotein family protein [Raphanus sativus]|uniref:Protein HEADING DATE 3B-like n=1 Tax=Raphanus sativus TaxID=3726 RepID=A0A9W3CLN4_RAPSA|nr:protein HEADING DATE 3B-like [Raphanus sativus]KAJ4872714.1 hydroxyproline-rich glycoprotein family protein [Raphanus sativus]